MNFYDLKANDARGNEVSMSEYKGKVVLVVNTATSCGFTPQYEGLQALYEKYKDQGFEILDFPCNQFANQVKGTEAEIHEFCSSRYGITFRLFEKIDVNGKNEHPVYTYLKSQKGGIMGKNIKWNFTKFLIDRNGNVVARFGSADTPEKIDKEVAALL